MSKTLEITLVSFGHKHGRPEADLFFDLRSLPNPYWKEELRTLNGQDLAVIEFFENSEEFLDALADIETKIMTKLYDLEQDFHDPFVVAIGCTGGQHRSVFAVEMLAKKLKSKYPCIRVQHKEQTTW